MASLNKVIIIGNLGRDPEKKATAGGTEVSNFSVAVSEKYKDQEHTEWFNCVAFGKTAEICNRYLQKGKPVYVEGKLKTRSWKNKDGETKKTTELNVDRVVLLGSRDSEAGQTRQQQSSYPAPDEQITDDDIPF